MRFIIRSLILLSLLAVPAAQAGADRPLAEPSSAWVDSGHKTVFKVHPLPAIGGTVIGVLMLPMELELALHPSFSLSVSGSPMLLVNSSGGGFALNGGLRGYLSGNAPDGFWLGAQLGVSSLSSGITSVTAVDLQPQIGYQWVTDSGFTIGLGAGVSVNQLMTEQFPLTFMLPIGFAW